MCYFAIFVIKFWKLLLQQSKSNARDWYFLFLLGKKSCSYFQILALLSFPSQQETLIKYMLGFFILFFIFLKKTVGFLFLLTNLCSMYVWYFVNVLLILNLCLEFLTCFHFYFLGRHNVGYRDCFLVYSYLTLFPSVSYRNHTISFHCTSNNHTNINIVCLYTQTHTQPST